MITEQRFRTVSTLITIKRMNMSTSLNTQHLCKITLLGNLVAKPEIRYLANPVVPLAEVTLATHSRWYDKIHQQFKEWTSFHTIKVIGNTVEQALLQANKGDVMLIHGYLLTSKKTQREIIHANFAQVFNKGYAQSMNVVQISGELTTEIKLMTTEHNKVFAEGIITTNHQVLSPASNTLEKFIIERPFHAWGKQAQYLYDNACIGNQIIIEGKLSYLKNERKSQYIEIKQSVILSE